jgi:hypothetical protein
MDASGNLFIHDEPVCNVIAMLEENRIMRDMIAWISESENIYTVRHHTSEFLDKLESV